VLRGRRSDLVKTQVPFSDDSLNAASFWTGEERMGKKVGWKQWFKWKWQRKSKSKQVEKKKLSKKAK